MLTGSESAPHTAVHIGAGGKAETSVQAKGAGLPATVRREGVAAFRLRFSRHVRCGTRLRWVFVGVSGEGMAWLLGERAR